MGTLQSKPGLSSTTTLNIPTSWDPTWFRNLISNQLKGADVRNAVGANGITVSGTIASPYATISLGAGPIVIPSTAGQVTLTVNGASGQYAETITPSGTAGNQRGLLIQGSTSNAGDILINVGVSTQPYFEVWGDGHFILGYNGSANTLTGSATGDVVINTPSVGNTLTLNQVSTYSALQMNSAAASATIMAFAPGGTASGYVGVVGTTAGQLATDSASGDMVLRVNGSAIRFNVDNGGTSSIIVDSGGHLILNAPGAGASLQITGRAAGSATISIATSATTGTGTATFTATNKPSATTGGPVAWIPVLLDGSTRYIPAWA
jgi:hypothetical protein